ncbi:MAG: hypothetical protein KAT34_13265 [Candidatus Aminicenantes bacterium]|nr:hypothetical protein [Candidatus Aminicenantes bacterium]
MKKDYKTGKDWLKLYDSKGVLISLSCYAYNKNGDIDVLAIYDNSGSLYRQEEYTYNRNNQLKYRKVFDRYGKKIVKIEFRYSQKGEVVEEKGTVDNKLQIHFQLEYLKYDYMGNWLKMIRSEKLTGKTEILLRSIEYYE